MASRPRYPNQERVENLYRRSEVPGLRPGLSKKHAKNFARGLALLPQHATKVSGKHYDWVWLSPNYRKANRTPYKGGDYCKTRSCREHVHGVVLHTTEGWRPPGKTFSDPKRGASSHYSVERDGSVTLIVPEKHIAWHAGTGVNDWSVGIEVVGFSVDDNKSAYGLPAFGFPIWQIRSLAKLVAGILKRWGLKPSSKTIFGHAHTGGCGKGESSGKVRPYAPNWKGRGGGSGCHYDPGDNFPWKRFISLVKWYYYRPTIIAAGSVGVLGAIGLGGFLLLRANPLFFRQLQAKLTRKRLGG